MDLTLFDRYELDINEENSKLILEKLEAKKKDWEKLLESNASKRREMGEEEKQKWERDRKILLSDPGRDSYRKEYYKTVDKIVDYVRKLGESEETFKECANIYGNSVDVNVIKRIYERNGKTIERERRDLKSVYDLAFDIFSVQKDFDSLIEKCDETVKSGFAQKGVDLTSLFDALSVVNCNSAKDIKNRAKEISKSAYELYNKRMFPSDIRDGFMSIFGPESKTKNSVASFVDNADFENFFGANNWVLLRYITNTCELMKRSDPIGYREISDIPKSDIIPFVEAMSQSFQASFEKDDTAGRKERSVPVEVLQGENKLKSGDFKSAKALFEKAEEKDHYCWQAYWGLFKVCIKAKTDKDIYFPNFLKELNGTQNEYPDYVDYYKVAKEYALKQEAAEINFAAIEREYKIADRVNSKFIFEVNELKSVYETESPDNIEYDKGKEVAAQMVKNREAIDKWTHVFFSNEILWVILAIAGGAILALVLLLGILYPMFGSMVAFLAIPLIAFFGLPLLYTILIFEKATDSVLLNILFSVAVFLANSFLAAICMDFFVGTVICAIVGIILLAIGIHGYYRIFSADDKVEKLQKVRKKYIDELSRCFFENVENMRKAPQYARYKIPNPNIALEIQEKISQISQLSSS